MEKYVCEHVNSLKFKYCCDAFLDYKILLAVFPGSKLSLRQKIQKYNNGFSSFVLADPRTKIRATWRKKEKATLQCSSVSSNFTGFLFWIKNPIIIIKGWAFFQFWEAAMDKKPKTHEVRNRNGGTLYDSMLYMPSEGCSVLLPKRSTHISEYRKYN